MGKWAAHFQQTYHGLDVWGGRVTSHLHRERAALRRWARSTTRGSRSTDAGLSARQAEGVAQGDLPFDAATDRIEDGTTLMVLPVPLSGDGGGAPSGVAGQGADRRPARRLGHLGRCPRRPDPLAVQRRRRHRLQRHRRRSAVEPGTWCNGESDRTAPRTTGSRSAGSARPTPTRTATGRIPYAGIGPAGPSPRPSTGPTSTCRTRPAPRRAFSGHGHPGRALHRRLDRRERAPGRARHLRRGQRRPRLHRALRPDLRLHQPAHHGLREPQRRLLPGQRLVGRHDQLLRRRRQLRQHRRDPGRGAPRVRPRRSRTPSSAGRATRASARATATSSPT